MLAAARALWALEAVVRVDALVMQGVRVLLGALAAAEKPVPRDALARRAQVVKGDAAGMAGLLVQVALQAEGKLAMQVSQVQAEPETRPEQQVSAVKLARPEMVARAANPQFGASVDLG